MAVSPSCEIMDDKTHQRCGDLANVYIFEGDVELKLCEKHYKIWEKRGKLELKR